MNLDPAICYRAVLARDVRYDGRFFTCVKTTGIYCRPICPARPPKLENCTFVPTAAAAQEAGFRPCLRCRPESSPDLDAWRGTPATVSRALKLIEGGALDDGDVASLADRLEIGVERASPPPSLPPPHRRRARHRRADPPHPAGQAAPSSDRSLHDRSGAGQRLRKRAAVQRNVSAALSASAERTPPARSSLVPRPGNLPPATLSAAVRLGRDDSLPHRPRHRWPRSGHQGQLQPRHRAARYHRLDHRDPCAGSIRPPRLRPFSSPGSPVRDHRAHPPHVRSQCRPVCHRLGLVRRPRPGATRCRPAGSARARRLGWLRNRRPRRARPADYREGGHATRQPHRRRKWIKNFRECGLAGTHPCFPAA